MATEVHDAADRSRYEVTVDGTLAGFAEYVDRGTVRIFGTDPASFDARWRIGYVPQRPTLASEVPATVEEIVTSGRLARRGWWRPLTSVDRRAVRHAIDSVGLGAMATTPVNTLSGGQQQRAFIARAFASEPELLVLDEPVAGVDAESQRRFSDSLAHLIREHGAGVLLVSHELSAVSDAVDRVIVLKKTVLFDGTPAELTLTSDVVPVARSRRKMSASAFTSFATKLLAQLWNET